MVWNTWRGLATVKHKSAPAQPRSERQLLVRSIAIRLARTWQSLTEGQRTSWRTYATLHPITYWSGGTKRLTGLNWFVGCNTALLLAAQDQINSAPTDPAPDPPTGVAATGGIGQLSIAWTDPSGETDFLQLWLHGPHSPGVLGKIQRATFNSYAAGADSPQVITGLMAGTYTVYVRTFDHATGLTSPWVSDTADVT